MKRILQLLLFIFISQISSAQCDASFHKAPKICGNDSAFFIFDGQTSTDNFFWDFGDTLSLNNSDSIKNPVHLFSDSGTYIITLIVKDTGNCTDTQTISVTILPKIKSDFTIISGLCLGDTTYFNNKSIPTNATWKWNFGDVFSGINNTSTIKNPKHKFTFSGSYKVKLVITDTNICLDSITKTIQIFSLPKANYSATNVCKNLNTVFKSTSIIDPLDSIVKSYWNTGDSFEDSVFILSHNYSDTGFFKVQYKLETKGGCKDSVSKTIRIYEAPHFTISKDSACRNANIQFTNIATSFPPNSYLWDFGDSSKSNLSSPIHQFKKSGNLKINLTHFFPDNYQCTSTFDSIFIFTPPNAKFTINNDTQCFNGNKVCVNFSANDKLSYRRVSFDDGFLDDFSSLSDTQVCYSYIDTIGGSYYITAELLDSNQCSNNFTFPNPVIIYPQLKLKYIQNTDNGCFKTDVIFQNISNQKPPQITKYKWDFGDGYFDSTHWNSVQHTFIEDGQFYTKLVATNSFGCSDSFEIENGIKNINFLVDAKLDSTKGFCRSNNTFFFSQTQLSDLKIAWYFGTLDSFYNDFTPKLIYTTSGKYFPKVHVSKDGCDSILFLDTLVVSGPTASIGNIVNQFQCEIKDTVTFYNNSYFYANKSSDFLWNFGDSAAPRCTTDTKKGLNLGMNCNFSTDSIPVKHWYTPGTENCFSIVLTVRDTILGCVDQNSTNIALQKPIASPQPNADPPIFGLFLQKQNICLGYELEKTISADLGFTQPSCIRQDFWVMWDSICAVKSGNFNSNWEELSNAHNYTYSGKNKPCSPDGKVTVGLIIQNGDNCFDTAWYHDVLSFLFMDPTISSTYNPAKYYCPGSTFAFSVLDTVQDSITKVYWDWGDGTFDDQLNIKTRNHTYSKSGNYRVKFYIENSRGCTGMDTSILVSVGLNSAAFLSRNNICINDTVHVNHDIHYRDNNKDYWKNPARAAQGKEHILWNFDVGNGFVDTFINEIKYSNAGDYKIKLIAVDSNGCHDTISFYDTLHVSAIFSSFNIQSDTLVCAQLIPFQNTSNLYDSISKFSQPNDSIKSYYWTFNPLFNTSSIQNPNIFLRPNNYTIQLKTESKFGCIDTSSHHLTILGPIAQYEIISDSIGCEPFNLVFKNNSINANTFVWQFNDSNNNSLITEQDTNIEFSYHNFGKFYPTLIAQGNFEKNGIPYTCSSIFPDSSIVGFREVTINETPKSNFSYKTDCSINTTQFYDSSKISTGNIISYFWDFGDGDTSTQKNPIHIYSDTGKFEVLLRTISDKYCSDSIIKKVVIAPVPKANFIASNTCLGDTTHFLDSSLGYNDNIYIWEWNLNDTITNFEQNPSKLFLKDTTYIISLKVTNIAGCTDSISDTIKIHSIPNSLFSFKNACDVDSITFKNNSDAKEMPLTYLWNFGDSTSDTSQNSIKNYGVDGNFEVTLIATSPYACSDSFSQNIVIYPSPQPKYSVDQSKQCFSGNQFNFSDTGKINSGSYNVVWYFGDGDSANTSNAFHSYKDTGMYAVKIIAISDFSCSDSLLDSVRVFPSPKADFNINNKQQCLVNNQYSFEDNSSILEGNYTIIWNFDNQLKHDSIVNYQFSDTGFFDIKLKINSNYSCPDSVVKSIRVLPMPIADFSIDDSAQCLSGNTFNFTNNSNISWGNLGDLWQFGDGDSATTFSPTHSYNSVDTFEVRLISTSQAFCSDTFYKKIIVFPMPKAGFTINDSGQCLAGNQFKFKDTSNLTYGNLSYRWDFGNNVSDSLKNPLITYSNHGDFETKLWVTSNQNCTDSISDSVYVYPMPMAVISIVDTVQCLRGNEFIFTDNSQISYGNIHSKWYLGDGNSDTNSMVQHSYPNYGNYFIKLISTSDENCKDSVVRSVKINAQPNADFSINDTFQCLVGNHFSFKNTSNIDEGIYDSYWDFGDNDTSTSFSTTHDYQNYGDFNVKLMVSSKAQCKDTIQKSIRINPNPIAKISINDSTQCENEQNFVFTDFSSIDEGTISSKWYFGDGDTSSQKTLIKSYKKQNTYTIKLVETSDKKCTDSATQIIVVYPKPHANFTLNDTDQCVNINHFVYNNKSKIDYGSLSYLWNFGDNHTDTNKNISHIYAQDDTLLVTLFATSDNQCKDTSTQTVIVFPIPETQFIINQKNQCVNTNFYQFVANATKIKYGKLIKFWWDLGNSNFNSGNLDTSNIYSFPDSSVIRFVALSEFGCYDTAYENIIIYPKPKANFTINDAEQCVNDQNFEYKNTSNISYGTLKYYWNLGDGDSSVINSPTKTYKKSDTLFVKLYAESDLNCWDTIQKQIVIFPKPNPDFLINDSGQCVNKQLFEFTNKSTIDYGILKYRWFYGDGDSSHNQNPNHVYAKDSTFKVKMIAISNQNCRDSLSKNIIVYPKPIADFVVNDKGQCINTQDFIFTNLSNITSGNLTYNWSFGDGLKDTQTNVTHEYAKNGIFNVKLLTTSEFLCVDSITKPIQVFAKPRATFTVNDSEQCINTQNFLYTATSTISEGKIIKHHWDFQNGFTANASPIISYFGDAGFYQVVLIEESDSQCFDTVSHITRVFPKPISLINYNDSAQCIRGNLYLFNSLSTDSSGIKKFDWNINNVKNATDSATQYIFRDTGFKDIQLIVNSNYNCWDTSLRKVYVKPMPNPDFTTLKNYYCDNESPFQLIPVTPGGTFYGQNILGDIYTPNILFNDTVQYYVTVNGCEDSSMQTTQVFPFPKIHLGPRDTTLCKREYLEFDVNFWKSTYLWQNGFNSPQYRILNEGKYKVSVTNICGTASDSIYVSYNNENCHLYLPTAFTPTHDGLNDRYKPIAYDVEDMEYYIYNRWGQLMFKGDLNDDGWDATFNGSPVSDGVFMVVVKYHYYAGKLLISETESGNLTILR